MAIASILAVNGSPEGSRGNTERLLQSFLTGARREGAATEVLYAADLHVEDCLGCYACWTRTPGCCVHRDDMASVLEKIRRADLVVWATPLYHYGMIARLKRVLERTLPLVKPWIIRRGDHFGHPARFPEQKNRRMLVSTCGFPERHHFSALEAQFALLNQFDPDGYLGGICCAAGGVLRVDALAEQVRWYVDAVERAGAEIVRQERISPEVRELLDRPLVPLEPFLLAANASWTVEGENPPSPETILGHPLEGAGFGV